jgi:hypothetical protein
LRVVLLEPGAPLGSSFGEDLVGLKFDRHLKILVPMIEDLLLCIFWDTVITRLKLFKPSTSNLGFLNFAMNKLKLASTFGFVAYRLATQEMSSPWVLAFRN